MAENRSRQTMLRIAALAAILFLSVEGAWSDDYKYWPGTLCWPTTPGASVSSFAGWLYNTSNVKIHVVCPVVRDTGGPYNVRLVLRENSPLPIVCTFAVVGWNGDLKWWHTFWGTGSGSEQFPANGGLIVGPGPNVTASHFALECDMPPVYNNKASAIIGIWTFEK